MPYGNVTDWITYAGLRGTTVANDAASAAAFIRGSDYIRTSYVIRWNIDDTDADALAALVEAEYIAAGYELATPGIFSGTYTPAQTKVLTEVKGIKWTVVGNTGRDLTAADMQAHVPAIEALLYPWVGQVIPGIMVV
jgi:hypothetical protein